MPQTRFLLPFGTSKVQLSSGAVLSGSGGVLTADSAFTAELLAAGCSRLDPALVPKPTIGPRVALLGDSIMRRYSTQTDRTDGTSFAGLLNMLLRQRCRIIYNGGVSGDTTAQMLARLPSIIDQRPDQIWFMGGTNDAIGNVPFSQTQANLKAIFDQIIAAGIFLVDFTTMPSSNITTGVGRDNLYRMNAWRRSYAVSRAGLMVSVDAWQALVNPQTGAPQSGVLADGTHPTEAGALAIARAGFDVLDKIIPTVQRDVASIYDPHNILFNGAMYGVAGTPTAPVTGSVADGWGATRTGTASSVASKVARADWRGSSWQRMAVTGGSNHERAQITNYVSPMAWSSGGAVTYGRRVKTAYADYVNVNSAGGSLAVGADPTASWSTNIGDVLTDGTAQLMCVRAYNPGDTLFGEVEFAASSMSGGWYPRATALIQDVAFATITTFYANYVDATETFSGYNNFAGIIRFPDFVLPANAYRVLFTFDAFMAAGVTGNVDVTNARLGQVSDFF